MSAAPSRLEQQLIGSSADGGSIPKRDDLVRTAQKGEKADKQQQEAVRWFFCALSKVLSSPLTCSDALLTPFWQRELEEPVVSDALGKLYNKSAALEYLLNPPAADGSSHSSFGADGDAVAAHLSSLKDLTTLKLTRNPTYDAAGPSTTDAERISAKWICPVSMKEMNGGLGRRDAGRWVYLKGCGCAVTEAGLKQLRLGSSTPEGECLICGTKYTKDSDTATVTINPGQEEEEVMRAGLAARKRIEKAEKERKKKEKKEAKDSKKRKADDSGVLSPVVPSADSRPTTDASESLKRPRLSTEKPRPSAPVPASKLATLIAAETEKKVANQSAAVASIYGPRDANGKQVKREESWMTRGTWTRYA